MDWKYVMSDRYMVSGSNHSDFIKIVKEAGYHFYTWNGKVWGISSNGDVFDTDIKSSELR